MKTKLTIILLFISGSIFAQNVKTEESTYCEELLAMLEADNKYRSMMDTFEEQRQGKVYDSLMNLQIKIDNKNTEKLLKLVNDKGWPAQKELNCQPEIFPMIIFRHSQKKYFSAIEKTIENELQQNRITEWEYKFIMNHLKGRVQRIN